MLNILVVDDSKSVHAFIRECFLKTQHVLTDTFDGQMALQCLEAGNKFDLILLDWEMPILTGPETFDEIRKRKIQTPVVMMTTRNSMEDISRMITAGVNEYAMKPFTRDILFEKIESALGKSIQNAT